MRSIEFSGVRALDPGGYLIPPSRQFMQFVLMVRAISDRAFSCGVECTQINLMQFTQMGYRRSAEADIH
jgi:hypothetical protein